jgi:hypothetical protein
MVWLRCTNDHGNDDACSEDSLDWDNEDFASIGPENTDHTVHIIYQCESFESNLMMKIILQCTDWKVRQNTKHRLMRNNNYMYLTSL